MSDDTSVSPETFRVLFDALAKMGVNCEYGCCRTSLSKTCPLRLENPGDLGYDIPKNYNPKCLRSAITHLRAMLKNKTIEERTAIEEERRKIIKEQQKTRFDIIAEDVC